MQRDVLRGAAPHALLILAGIVTAAPAALAQTGQQMPRRGGAAPQAAPRTASTTGGSRATEGRIARPQAQAMQVSAELEAILQRWEQQSSRIQKLSGEHSRFIYRKMDGTELRGRGSFAFAAPDKGMLEIKPSEVPPGTTNPQRVDMNGEPLEVRGDPGERWVCDGEQILQFELSVQEKQYSRIEIPPSMRGENIIQGPLPFLFGVSAGELKRRYRMTIGSLNKWSPQNPTGTVHVVAYPLRKVDSQSWQKADVLLDGRTFLPTAIRMMDGHDKMADETTYKFDVASMKVNAIRFPWKSDPFRPNLKGWKMIENHVADPERLRQMAPPK